MERIEFKVKKEMENVRIDRFLRKIHPKLTQGEIENFLRKGLVRLNEKKCKSNEKIQDGDMISIAKFLNDELNENVPKSNGKINDKMLEEFRKFIIFQNSDLIAINKPSGLAVQGGSKISHSVDDFIKKLAESENFECAKLVHRIDKETSGLLIFAITEFASMFLTKMFREKEIEKEYLAIVKGQNLKTGIGEIRSEINNTEAITKFELLAKNADSFSFLRLKPVSGRKHQLRIHCAENLKAPILNDARHGGENFGTKKMNLHAHKMKFAMPNGQEIELKADLPSHFLENLENLGLSRDILGNVDNSFLTKP